MLQKTSKHVLGSNEVDWMSLLRKNPPEFCYPEITDSGGKMHPFRIILRAVTKWSKTLPNMF